MSVLHQSPTSGDGDAVAASRSAGPGGDGVLYPERYVWFVFFSAMDVLLTYVILSIGGREVNPLANRVLETAGFNGMIGYKFALVAVVLVICEYVGRRRDPTGRRLAMLAVLAGAFPVCWSLGLLARAGLGALG